MFENPNLGLMIDFAVSIKEHRVNNPKFLSFGTDQVIEDVKTFPGRYWQGRVDTQSGLFVRFPLSCRLKRRLNKLTG